MTDLDQPVTGRFAGQEHRFPVRVYFEDTDLSGIVYHANYLRFMERARSDMLRCAGIDQRAAFEAGEGAYAVRHMDLDFVAPAKLDDALLVVSRVSRVRAAAVDIQQRVMRGDAILLDATVEAVFVAPSGRPRRQPKDWVAAFTPLITKGK
ncbi:tol-pal system-associated acyl-CoA thioesterase [Stakelama saccharophila]|uniref:Tol-pal system-associated acyl-CoA thioesterase n=1 Tax=Stakelama saccharophila TaxID=3075605 RepID=A0ABZ0BD31_9SPHN|nr:tol-pal system-associated acyl-CoA thioesterase [Stakelama sp. W311]WNO54611.1 tol-pal system-associated acyl-CoA thioesterase [Stakelama sp. W311]